MQFSEKDQSWWKLNEASGTRNDSYGVNHLTDNNTVGSTPGKQGNAALFALANSEYLSIPDNASLSMGAGARMTVCTWVKLTSKSPTQIQEFVAKSGTTNGTYEYFLRYDGVIDRFEYVVTSNGNSSTQVEAQATTFGSPALSTWYFLCGGYDGANIWVSVNAGTRDTVAYSADIYDGAATNALQVGRYTGNLQYLDGALDEAVIYKRSLTPGEVSWMYNSGAGRTYNDLGTGTTYTYNAAHKHAVASLSSGETYSYDANGNMITRVEGGLTYAQVFNAENRLISVTVSGQTTQFVYDGDGNMVKKINPNGSRTIYVGGVYEVDKASGGAVTRTVTYYPVAGAMRINSTLYYTLKDHLGSASVVTDSTGAVVGEQRYYPFGETRVSTGTIYTDRLFTGQREMAGLGIYHYNARFYSPKLGRFLSPDTIVPGAANPQAYNRYSYVLNNPLLYIDPTGHAPQRGIIFESDGPLPLASYGVKVEGKLSSNTLLAMSKSVRDIAKALGKANGKDAVSSFKEAFSGGVTVRKWPSDKCTCAAEVSQDGAGYELRIYQDQWAGNHPDLFIHELGHIYYNLHNKEFTPMGSSLRRPDYGNTENRYHGFSSGQFKGQFAVVNLDYNTEIFADMFLGWVYDKWTLGGPDHAGEARKDWMSVNMAGS